MFTSDTPPSQQKLLLLRHRSKTLPPWPWLQLRSQSLFLIKHHRIQEGIARCLRADQSRLALFQAIKLSYTRHNDELDIQNVIALLNVLAYSPSATAWSNASCTYPSPCWPANDTWKSLNKTLRGSLFRAHPPAAPCHLPYTDDAACSIAKQNWTSQFWRAQQPGGYHDAAWENGDSYCNIDSDPSTPCAQGLVPQYVAKVQNADDVKAAVNFARNHKLSTRVKGTSHDLDSVRAANAHGVVVVGGASYSVGVAGGWVLGGGHSPISTQYGLGVDNVVQFEIVTPDGKLRIANQYENKDLFWALRGGGPGFGVVTKVTYRTHPPITATSALILNITYGNASYHGVLENAGYRGYFTSSLNSRVWRYGRIQMRRHSRFFLPRLGLEDVL
ncbi:hypothetical protein FRC19_011520 [Serendipita sp. 401]|nr:hypothetical protein FRC19_011520 [Serendipita sp. 401]KAG9052492.1 hypothetical protein FS842_009778 [Serendipita sp. 407]